MKKTFFKKICQRGFSLIEALIALGLLSLVVTAYVGAVGYGNESSALSGTRTRGIFLAEEGLEAVRNIRDNSFSNLVNGTFGIASSSNQWIFTAATSDVSDIYTRQITIGTVDTQTKVATSTVTWTQNGQRTGSVILVSYFTNFALPQSAVFLAKTFSLSASKKQLLYTAQNTGTSSISISSIKYTASPTYTTQTLTSITINGTSVWTGSAANGTTVTLSALSIPAATSYAVVMTYSAAVNGNSFALVFTMVDASTKATTTPSL